MQATANFISSALKQKHGQTIDHIKNLEHKGLGPVLLESGSVACSSTATLSEVEAARAPTKRKGDVREGKPSGAPKKPRPAHVKPRKPLICKSCNLAGHKASECPVRGGLVHEAPVALTQLEGKSAAAALDILQPEAKEPSSGDDRRAQIADIIEAANALGIVIPGAPAKPDELSEEAKAAKREKQLSDLRANLVDKAVTMLLTKEISSVADRKVVLQSLVQLARKEKMYEKILSSQDELMSIYASAVKKAFDLRLKTARDLSMSRISDGKVSVTRMGAFSRGVGGSPGLSNSWEGESLWSKSDLDILSFFETTTPFSLIDVNNKHLHYYYAGLFLRLLFSLFAEKLVYTFMFAVLAIRGSPGSMLLCGEASLPVWGVDFVGNAFDYRDLDASKDFRRCAERLSFMAVITSFLMIVTFELFCLFRTHKNWVDRFGDGVLRISFHMLDAFVSLGFIQPVFIGIPQITGGYAVDLPRILCGIVLLLHLFWNTLCLFYWKQPHRCFSIAEAYRCVVATVYEDTCLEDVPLKTCPVQANFEVRSLDPVCKPKASIFACWGLYRVIPTVFRNCSHNEEISMNGRVGKLLPAHESPVIFQRIRSNWRVLIKALDQQFIPMIPIADERMDFYEWAVTFPPRRRDELIRTRVNTHDMPELSAKSFIKREIAPKDACDPMFKDPRFIQGCPLELSCAVGPVLRPWTKQVRDALRPTGYTSAEIRGGKHIIYTCGLSNEAIGDAFRRSIVAIEELAGPNEEIVFLEDDQSRFDLHLTEGPFSYLNHIYKKKLPKKTAALLKRSISKGTSCLGTKYTIPHTMQSGWPDTSVGDTLVNAGMKTQIHGSGRSWVSIICGDDSVTITTRSEMDRLGGVGGITMKYAAFGMEVTAKVSTDPLDVEFCSGRFFPVGSTYVLFPRVGRILSKIACDLKIRSPENRLAWLRGITATLRDYARFDPVLGALGESFDEQLGFGKVLIDDGWEFKQSFDGSLHSSPHDVYTYYDHHYGLSSAQVKDLVVLMRGQKIGSLCQDTVVDQLALYDTA